MHLSWDTRGLHANLGCVLGVAGAMANINMEAWNVVVNHPSVAQNPRLICRLQRTSKELFGLVQQQLQSVSIYSDKLATADSAKWFGKQRALTSLDLWFRNSMCAEAEMAVANELATQWPFHWKQLDIKCKYPTATHILSNVSPTHLTSLCVDLCESPYIPVLHSDVGFGALTQRLTTLTSLQSLTVYGDRWGPREFAVLPDLSGLAQLTSLRLSYFHIDRFQCLPAQLRRLEIKKLDGHRGTVVIQGRALMTTRPLLLSFLTSLTSLQILDGIVTEDSQLPPNLIELHCRFVGHGGSLAVVTSISSLRVLATHDFGSNNSTDYGSITSIRYTHNNVYMQLCVANATLLDQLHLQESALVSHMLPDLCKLTKLHTLILDHCRIHVHDNCVFLSSLAQLTSLTRFEVDSLRQIDDSRAALDSDKLLIDMLGTVSSSLLSLSHLSITDVGIRNITGSIKVCLQSVSSLRHLDLSGTSLGWQDVHSIIEGRYHLRVLDISGNMMPRLHNGTIGVRTLLSSRLSTVIVDYCTLDWVEELGASGVSVEFKLPGRSWLYVSDGALL